MSAADIVVIPWHHEGFGVAAAEAMALGKPVVATRAGGLPEVIGLNGRLVEPGDVNGLRSAILELADDVRLREQLGAQAASAARLRFEAAPV
jgi:glycosyltransferase involved in cell wall biosynthesis